MMSILDKKLKPYYVDGIFYNYNGEVFKPFLLPSFLMYLTGWRKRVTGLPALMQWNTFAAHLEQRLPQIDMPYEILWIGHASFLIKLHNMHILLDPVFDHLAPLFFRRYTPPGIALADLPHIDAVLISHNHRDHMEKATLQKLAQRYNPCFYVPQGDGRILQQWGITRFIESSWWDQHIIPARHPAHSVPVTLTFLPAVHWSKRSLFDTNRSLWGSWMISTGKYTCYFAGDTAYGKHFEQIAHYFPNIQVALLPIGPCEPSELLRKSHINAEEAGQAFIELKAQLFVPMHWGAFGFGHDQPLAPLERMNHWWSNQINLLPTQQLHPLRMGQRLICTPASSSPYYTKSPHATRDTKVCITEQERF